jgi:hypothetical protein
MNSAFLTYSELSIYPDSISPVHDCVFPIYENNTTEEETKDIHVLFKQQMKIRNLLQIEEENENQINTDNSRKEEEDIQIKGKSFLSTMDFLTQMIDVKYQIVHLHNKSKLILAEIEIIKIEMIKLNELLDSHYILMNKYNDIFETHTYSYNEPISIIHHRILEKKEMITQKESRFFEMVEVISNLKDILKYILSADEDTSNDYDFSKRGSILCGICNESVVDICISPCGHTFCECCIDKLSSQVCPFCRLHIQTKIKMFFS